MAHYDIIADDRNIGEASSVWDSPLEFGRGANTYSLVKALLSQADRIDSDLTDIYHQQYIDSATGKELDQFGELVQTNRQTGESDEKYRARIKAAFRASTMGGTYDQFAQYVASVLNTDISNLSFRTDYEALPATVIVRANSSVFNSVNLTNQEVVDLLGRGVPAGHAVEVTESGTFLLKADGDTDTAENGLTSDSISTGGTLAGDIA